MTDGPGPGRPGAVREDALRLVGSLDANRVMEAELLRLVKRSPFDVRVPRARREGGSTLTYPFDPAVAWVAACYHRTSSRVAWDLCSSPARRLEPLVDGLTGLLAEDERLGPGPRLGFTVVVGDVEAFEAGPLQVRGAVKSALVGALGARGIEAVVEAERPDVTVLVRHVPEPAPGRVVVSLDLGGGARQVRGTRRAKVTAPLAETLAAQLVMLSRWDARAEPLVDPMAGGATIPIEAALMARGAAVRAPVEIPALRLPAFASLPKEAPPLFADTSPRVLACDSEREQVLAMVGNLRGAGLAGPEHERSVRVLQRPVRDLGPPDVAQALDIPADATGVLAFDPPQGKRLAPAGGERELLATYAEIGRMLQRFRGWRAVVLVSRPELLEAIGLEPDWTKRAVVAGRTGSIHGFRM